MFVMAISNGFWPLILSVESLVLREILPIYTRNAQRPRKKTGVCKSRSWFADSELEKLEGRKGLFFGPGGLLSKQGPRRTRLRGAPLPHSHNALVTTSWSQEGLPLFSRGAVRASWSPLSYYFSFYTL
jgi:hypothetical protein